ncbi:MAG: flagellar basal-body rod protein FlgF [Rhodospirillales bacterium]|nr:MAG: flagellar basal-body rod protein FlgF [Rhodospirillales bacterium]
MENTLLIALSHQAALRRRLEVIANNVANMNTTGFKAEQPMFAEVLVRSRGGETARGELLSFVLDRATRRDIAAGPLVATGNPLDVAIVGEGYFVVMTPTGENVTRQGRFRLDDAGQVVTEHGFPVMAEGDQPLVLGAEDGDITIGRNGVVSTANGEIGRLRIVRFDNEQELRQVAGGLLTADQPGEDMAAPELAQGMLEGSNVEPVREITRLIEVQRAYDSASRLIDREDERIRKMIEEYGR